MSFRGRKDPELSFTQNKYWFYNVVTTVHYWKNLILIKKTLQLILRTILKLRFFSWLSVFLLHRWKYSHNDLKLRTELLKALYKTCIYVLLSRLVYKVSCYLFSNLYYSFFVPATLFPTYHALLTVGLGMIKSLNSG